MKKAVLKEDIGRPVKPHVSGGAVKTGSYWLTCPSCGAFYDVSVPHACASAVYTPSDFYTPKITTTIVGGHKPIEWVIYSPAKPPTVGKDYLIVYIDSTGKKQCSRGTFSITPAYVHEWKNELGVPFIATVTHFAEIILP